jgi:protein phosphatase
MGGYGGGQEASRTSLQALYEQFYTSPATEIQEALCQAMQSANMAVRRLSMQPSHDARMGTTLVTLVLNHATALIAHVGDSRAYHIRRGIITQLTADHSVVQEKVQAGLLSVEQSRLQPGKNVLTRSVGSTSIVQADYTMVSDLAPGDVFVLCSDGLTNQVLDEEIAHIVSMMPPESAAQALVQLANERGGPDNITVLLVRIDKLPVVVPSESGADGVVLAAGKPRTPLLFSIALSVVVVVSLVAIVILALSMGWLPRWF